MRVDLTEPKRHKLKDGGELQYWVAGAGEPIVFVHGFGIDSEMWGPQWAAFAARYRVIRYDLRGYGCSTLPTGPYSHVDDLLSLVRAVGARPAHLVGLSMGGRIAMRAAAQESSAWWSLTLADTALDGHVWSDEWLRRWKEITKVAAAGDAAGAAQMWLQHPLFGPAQKHPDVANVLGAMVARYSGWHLSNRDPDTAPPARTVEDALSTVSSRTLVIVGEHDLPDFHAIARRTAQAIPSATLAVIAGAGHMTNLEAPDEFNRLVSAHLQQR